VPVYNSEQIVETSVDRTVRYLDTLGISYEIVLVNDASRDRSWNILKTIAGRNSHVTAINLLKNCGQHTAILCGIRHSRGDYVVTMDDDLQNPPEEIGKLIDRISEGYDLVFAKFRIKQHNFVRRVGSKMIGYLNKQIFNKPDDITLTNFRIFNRAVANRVSAYRTAYPYIPGLLLMCSGNMANVEAEHSPRAVGESNYTPAKILHLVSALLFNYSSYPLKVLTAMGFFVSLISFSAGVFFVIKSLFIGTHVAGWTTVVSLLAFLNGFIIIMLGILGEYVSRLINQVSADHIYHIQDVVSHGD
jgi:glycosyltransferase involved in cell wall biosynthesis